METFTNNNPSTSITDNRCLTDLFIEQVKKQPDHTAVIYDHESLTYQELAQQSAELAQYLQFIGITPDTCVGLFVDPSMELMIGSWGIILAGAAYLPLSPEYPEERIKYMVEDSKIEVVFCQDNLKARLTSLIPNHVTIITPSDIHFYSKDLSTSALLTLESTVAASNLAYIIYTSGSTGRPKGVMIEHKSIVNQMAWLQQAYRFDKHTIVLQKTPMSFDAAQWEILAPCFGATVVVGAPGVYRDPEGIIKTIIRHQVTSFQCVPTLLQAMLDTIGAHDCTSLKHIFSGGEILTKHLANQCFETLPETTLVNLYGPTECTINSSAYVIDKAQVAGGPNALSIGYPVANTQYYILDSKGEKAAVGEIGELFIGGIQLARGYLHKADMTNERFVDNPFIHTDEQALSEKLYRTGDLAYWNDNGSVQFSGRVDNQIKLRGFRVELDEIRLAIEDHSWVKNAAMIIKHDARTSFQNLIACIELNPKEAALMDQGNHGAHHQSKKSKLQVKAQLSNKGCRERDDDNQTLITLLHKDATPAQRALAYSRKTYRFFEGGEVAKEDLLTLLSAQPPLTSAIDLSDLNFESLSKLLRNFGQFSSPERLLPKYGYASPGALYATQMYLEMHHIAGLESGVYYYHPVHHELILITSVTPSSQPAINIHFMGKNSAIEPVYKNNIQEVLEMEVGHMLGLFDKILPSYGLSVGTGEFIDSVKPHLDCAEEDFYLGSFPLVSFCNKPTKQDVAIYVQTHADRIAGMPAGQYQYRDNQLVRLDDELILKKDVIAINQQVYERASFGISMVCESELSWQHYIALGRKLQLLQMNDLNLGLMSSGYSSKSGNDLPSATRIKSILNRNQLEVSAFYFCIGGRISDEQRESEGMKEDTIHMRGPVEMIKDDLLNLLPNYMVPNKIIIMDALPQTANGKIDYKALEASEALNSDQIDKPFIAPRTEVEEKLGDIWKAAMKWDAVSVTDDFFESGGNSLMAVSMINKINKQFQIQLPLQVLFEAPTVEALARKVTEQNSRPSSRLIPLSKGNKPDAINSEVSVSEKPIYCWPGLGGYPMNLRLLANSAHIHQPFVGIQAYGINEGEMPYPTIAEMATRDIAAIKRQQPTGPYTLWGYSFGARVAFETAYQLEQQGDDVKELVLIAPGSPKLHAEMESQHGNQPTFNNLGFVTILFSVFAHNIDSPALKQCLKVAKDEISFATFINERYPHLDVGLVLRITQIVKQTYEFEYSFKELQERQLKAKITILKAQGDNYSFIENSHGFSRQTPTVIELTADHYSLLKQSGIDELSTSLKAMASNTNTETLA
ncbi:amino acid adenylation domain-containing protein [Flocculibacter collagenilyticus]|uniref:amino acid adenylation domain-containing protein n=1 Tax=Flocculibacter collagenilyticus TaxID=2744479 RepID=UPI0018F4AA26|nr:amino acid adenylation domain-containing protein [Flocculibacter collagenilyticus]